MNVREWLWRALVIVMALAAFALAGAFAARLISLEDAAYIEKGPR